MDPAWLELLEVVRAALGQPLPPELGVPFSRGEDPWALMDVAALLGSKGLTSLASRVVVLAFRLAGVQGLADRNLYAQAVELYLVLHANSRLEEAGELLGALSDWLDVAGVRLDWLQGEHAVRWAMLEELMALPAGFPGQARAMLALSLRSGDLMQGMASMAQLAQLDREHSDRALDMLADHSPGVYRAMRQVVDLRELRLRPWERPPDDEPVSVVGMFNLVRLAAGLFLLLLIGSVTLCRWVGEDAGPPMLGVLGGLDWRASGLPDSVRHATEAHYESTCTVEPLVWTEDGCAMAERALELSLRNRCAEARPLLAQLVEQRGRDDERLTEQLHEVLRRTCGGTPP